MSNTKEIMQLELIGACFTLGIVIYLRTLEFAFGGIICSWSRNTSQKVASCPESQEEMEVRAKKKKCESIAHGQKCTTHEKIKYHCVMNELENAFIEVCAPVYRIHGYCTEYNEVGTVIQAHHNLKCETVKPPCDSSYLSTDAYRYKGCYDIVRNKTKRSYTKSIPLLPSTPGYFSNSVLRITGKAYTHTLTPLLYLLSILYTVSCV